MHRVGLSVLTRTPTLPTPEVHRAGVQVQCGEYLAERISHQHPSVRELAHVAEEAEGLGELHFHVRAELRADTGGRDGCGSEQREE